MAEQPTQVRHPWRSTVRTGFQVVVALASLLPYVVAEIDVPVEGLLAQVLAVAVGITRVMAMPQVSTFLERFLPGLAPAGGTRTRPQTQEGPPVAPEGLSWGTAQSPRSQSSGSISSHSTGGGVGGSSSDM